MIVFLLVLVYFCPRELCKTPTGCDQRLFLARKTAAGRPITAYSVSLGILPLRHGFIYD